MQRDLALKIVDSIWVVWLLYWLITGVRAKPAKRTESPASRASYAIFAILGCLLVFSDLWPDFLAWRIFPVRSPLMFAGVAIALLGIAFSVWARICLGRNWSSQVSIKQDHELVSRGPYARVRHPIYTGVLLALLGTALVFDQCRALAGFALVAISFSIKALKEDAILTQEFGEAFAEHKRRAGLLLPRLLPH